MRKRFWWISKQLMLIANCIVHFRGINLIPVTISKSNLRVQSVQWIINRKFSTLFHHHHRSSRGLWTYDLCALRFYSALRFTLPTWKTIARNVNQNLIKIKVRTAIKRFCLFTPWEIWFVKDIKFYIVTGKQRIVVFLMFLPQILTASRTKNPADNFAISYA